jgi:hypothetical protein
MYYKISFSKLFRDFIVNFLSKIKTHFRNYIDARMDGAPYFAETDVRTTSSSPASASSVDDIFLSMPPYLREGIGKYGSEIQGSIAKTGLPQSNDALDILTKYIETLDLPTNKTYHTFEDCVPFEQYQAIQEIKYGDLFIQIAKTYPNQVVVPIVPMNELYVSCLGADGSDRVFETPHIDGLFAWLPWCVVLRGVVAIQGNRHIDTVFPLSQNIYTLETGEFVAFDYNRSIHYICGSSFGFQGSNRASFGSNRASSVGSNRALQTVGSNRALQTVGVKNALDKRTRIILKLHYLVHPEWLPLWISKLYIGIHGKYNAFLRSLFLQSQISPENQQKQEQKPTYLQSLIAYGINNTTTIYVKLFLLGLFFTKCLGYCSIYEVTT